MPWTVSHAAAVLPFRRWCPARLSFAALVLGSMSPDFGYYFGLHRIADYAHTPPGIVAVALPAGLLMVAALCLLRPLLVVLLPQPHRRAAELALESLAGELSWRRAPALAGSLLLGAATHAAWDSFTHAGGFPVERIELLQRALFGIGAWRVETYNFLQHASTLFGIVVLALAYRAWLRSGSFAASRPAGRREIARWWIVGTIAALGAAACAAWIAAGVMQGTAGIHALVVQSVFVATNLMALAYLAAAIAWRLLAGAR